MTTTRKPIILFDMDCSLFDYQHSMITALNAMAENESELITVEENLWHLDNNPVMNARQEEIKARKNWWRDLPPIALGFDIYNHCKNLGYKIEILTKGPRKFPNAWAEKLECCQIHFGSKVNVNVVTHKQYFFGDILYDDFPSYQSAWLKQHADGLGIMPAYPSNYNYFNSRLIRLDNSNVEEVKERLIRLIKEFK